jgi:CheY-like chemotaxis protein
MEAVGRLAGGVAHDFNNLLTVMRANAEFLSQLLPVNGQEREDIDAITKSVDRASALTRQLLAFSRQQVMQPAIVEPNEIVADLEKMLSRLIGEDIDLRIDLGVDVPVVRVDPGQLEQAIVNLIVNARDAMPFGGPLRITTSTLKVTAAAAAAHGVVDEGSYAAISVNDSGTGMSPAVRARIFEPFFTTKEIGLGTGLGLASVYGMVKQFGGFIDVDSVEGEGSTFTIALPACPLGDPTTREAADAAAGEGAGQTILVVEDEADVRAVSSRILTGHGYRVIEASNGLEAIERLEDVKTRVDMVITDAVMPKMGGAKLIEAVRARRPGVPVLMVSGYTNKELGLSVKDESTVELLHKPFRSEELLRRVRGLLEQRA